MGSVHQKMQMTAVIALPDAPDERELAEASVCGLPLLVRVLAAAAKSGATNFIFLERLPEHPRLFDRVVAHPLLNACCVRTISVPGFNPERAEDWRRIGKSLPPFFLWLPWNLIVSKLLLKNLWAENRSQTQGGQTIDCQHAVAVCRDEVLSASPSSRLRDGTTPEIEAGSFLVTSSGVIGAAERHLIRNSGKKTDGLYSRINRRLCWPLLTVLCRTPVRPNAITVFGLLLSAVSGCLFAQGHWGFYLLGALAYFACVLCDEMDGMLARLTFSDSALGCWLETVADYASYMFLFGGLTLGLYRQNGATWLWTGLLMIAGSAILMFVLSYQRKMITEPDKPQEFRKRLQQALDDDRSNPISWLGRNLEFMIRKPAYCYWVLLFCAFGFTKLLVALTALGANAAWMMALSYNRLFRPLRIRATILGGEQS